MLKYQCLLCGDFYRKKLINGKLYDDHDYYNFQIEVPIPINYSTKKEAEGCHCSLRFEVEDGHVVLRIYSDWKQGIDKNGSWHEHISGNVIDTIRWKEYWKYKTSRSKIISKNMHGFIDAQTDYIPDATPWDELFDINNQPKDWCNTVELLSYSINIFDVKEPSNVTV